MKKAWLALAGCLVTGAVGCEASQENKTEGWDPSQSTSTAVAQIDLAQGQKFEIYATQTGEFGYSQSGKYGVAPVPVAQALWNEGDPVKIFQALAPGKDVPPALVAARNRALARATQDLGNTPNESPAIAHVQDGLPNRTSGGGDGVEQSQSALSTGDVTTTGSTGQPGCPFAMFKTWYTDGRPFCPASSNRAGCMQSKAWAFASVSDAWDSYGDICQEAGEGVFKTSNGDPNNPTDTFYVGAGSWRYVHYLGGISCGPYGCSHVRNFKKFDLQNFGFGTNSAHFGYSFGY